MCVLARPRGSQRRSPCARSGIPPTFSSSAPRNVARYPDGRRTLRFRRGKTDVPVEVEIIGELAAAIEPSLDSAYPTFVRRRNGKPYTVSGLGAMFRRYCVGTEEAPRDPKIEDFEPRDLRAKGATDMYRAGVPTREIQHLLGHTSVRTTEIYIKGLLAEIVRPNKVPIVAGVK